MTPTITKRRKRPSSSLRSRRKSLFTDGVIVHVLLLILIVVVSSQEVVSAFQQHPNNISTNTNAASSRSRRRTSFTMGERQQVSSTSTSTTRLSFNDLDDSSNSYTTCTINHQQWCRRIFNYSPTLLAASSVTSTSATRNHPSSSIHGSDEQDNNDVDIYLDFLEKRYRRIHENDDKNEKDDQKRDELLSAMDWFVGHNNKKKIIDNDDDDDDENNTTDETKLVERKKEMRNVDDNVMESKDKKDQDQNQDHQYQLDTFVVHQLFVPFLRVRKTMQRQQQFWKQRVFQQLHRVARRMTTSKGRRIIPTSLLWNRTCMVLGGTQNSIRTLLALGSTILLVFRPILHPVFSALLHSSSTSSLIRREIRIQ